MYVLPTLKWNFQTPSYSASDKHIFFYCESQLFKKLFMYCPVTQVKKVHFLEVESKNDPIDLF